MENIQVCILVSAILIFIVIYVCIFSRVFHESFVACNTNSLNNPYTTKEKCSKFDKKGDCNQATLHKVEWEEITKNDDKTHDVVGNVKPPRNCAWDSSDRECRTTEEECTVTTPSATATETATEEEVPTEFKELVNIIGEDITAFREYKNGKFQSDCQKWMKYDMGKKELEDYYYSKLDEEDRAVFNHVCKDWWEDNDN